MTSPIEDQVSLTRSAEQPDEPIDEGFVDSTRPISTTSIDPSIFDFVLEGDRWFHAEGPHQYGLPLDWDEPQRGETVHLRNKLARQHAGKDDLISAPIGENPQNILDLGTGTGIWAIDMSDKYPSAKVIGTDISPIQPTWVPPNCHFQIFNYESKWNFNEPFDFIHLGNPDYSVRDWPRLLRQTLKALRPGAYAEVIGDCPLPYSQDDTMPAHSGVRLGFELLYIASQNLGTLPDYIHQVPQLMEDAGFINIKIERYIIPCAPWAKNETLKNVGRLQQKNLQLLASATIPRLLSSWDRTAMEVMMAQLRQDALNKSYLQCFEHWVVYGQKGFSDWSNDDN